MSLLWRRTREVLHERCVRVSVRRGCARLSVEHQTPFLLEWAPNAALIRLLIFCLGLTLEAENTPSLSAVASLAGNACDNGARAAQARVSVQREVRSLVRGAERKRALVPLTLVFGSTRVIFQNVPGYLSYVLRVTTLPTPIERILNATSHRFLRTMMQGARVGQTKGRP